MISLPFYFQTTSRFRMPSVLHVSISPPAGRQGSWTRLKRRRAGILHHGKQTRLDMSVCAVDARSSAMSLVGRIRFRWYMNLQDHKHDVPVVPHALLNNCGAYALRGACGAPVLDISQNTQQHTSVSVQRDCRAGAGKYFVV